MTIINNEIEGYETMSREELMEEIFNNRKRSYLKPEELYKYKLIKNARKSKNDYANKMEIYKLCRSGELSNMDVGTENRGQFFVSQEDIDAYNAQF